MTVTDEAPQYPDIEEKLADIKATLQSISPEVIAGHGESVRRAKVLHKRIADLEEEKRVRALAEQEQQRRAAEAAAKRDYEQREMARREFVGQLDSFVEIEGKVTQLVDDLLAACQEHKVASRRLHRLAIKAATPDIRVSREGLAQDLLDYLQARMRDLIPGIRVEGSKTGALAKHAAWVERARESLKTPLGERQLSSRERKLVEREPVEAVWFTPPPIRNSKNELVTQSVLVSYDGVVKLVTNPGMKETTEGRSFYQGGRWAIVKPEDVGPILKAGFELKKGIILSTGAYTVLETLKKEEESATAH